MNRVSERLVGRREPGASGGWQLLSLRGVGHMWERNLRVYRDRWVYALLPNFFEPVFYLFGLGLGLGAYVSGGGEFEGGYLAFIIPGLVAAAAMNGAAFETTYNIFVKLRFDKLYDAIVTTRVNMEDVAAGEILWSVTRSFLYGAVFLLVTLFFGTPLTWRLLLALPAIALVGYCFSAIGMAFTSVIRIIDVYAYYFTMFITPSFLFSGIFFPVVDRFPPTLVVVAQWTPLYNGVQLMRGIIGGDFTGVWLHALYLATLGTLLSVFAIVQMRRQVIV